MPVKNSADEITARQAVMLIMAVQLGIGLLTLPSDVARMAGHDGWLSVLFGGLLFFLSAIAIIALCNRFEGSSILEINRAIFGKFFSYIINTMFLIYLITAATACLTSFAFSVGAWFFQSTPMWALVPYISVPSVYLAYKGLKGVCRFNFLLVALIPILLSLVLFTLKNVHFHNLMPVGVHGLPKIAGAFPQTALTYMGFETLLFIFPNIKDKQHVLKYTSLGFTAMILILTIFTADSIAVFGEDMLKVRISAFVGFAKMISVPVLERIDLYYFSAWIAAMVLALNAYMFLAYNSVRSVYKINSHRICHMVVSAVVIIISVFTARDIYTDLMLNKYAAYGMMAFGTAYPVLLLLIAWITRKGVKKKE
jgi:spore germination protein (amino acid permease)